MRTTRTTKTTRTIRTTSIARATKPEQLHLKRVVTLVVEELYHSDGYHVRIT